MAASTKSRPKAVDLFAGAGGATQGLVDAGFHIVAAVENNCAAVASYKANHPAVHVDSRDIRHIDPAILRVALRLRKGQLDLLKACPPCQGHSSLSRIDDDPRNELITNVWLFVKEFRPKIVLLENVPRIRTDPRLMRFVSRLSDTGYAVTTAIADARDFGVPQRRKRFILIAARGKCRSRFSPYLLQSVDPAFLQEKISLASIFAYDRTELSKADPLHISPSHSKIVSARISAIPRDGNRFDLPKELALRCHTDLRDGATASYGRISLKAGFAPTMTTRCTSASCGSFLHPTKNRAITLREASLIQTFPPKYSFKGTYTEIERQIGNAVPVRMAYGLARIVRNLLR